MSNKEPIFNANNFYLFANALFGASATLFLPYTTLVICFVAVVIFYGSPGVIGAIFVPMGALFTYIAEFVIPSASAMADEIRNDDFVMRLESEPGSERAYGLLMRVLDLSVASHRFVSRSIETLLVVGGGVLIAYVELVKEQH